MAVQEAGREKEMQKMMGNRGMEDSGPNSSTLAPPGPTKPRREASPEDGMKAGGLRAACTVSRRGVHTIDGAPRSYSQRMDL